MSAESAAFLRGEAPVGAEFTAGAPEVRSGATQIAMLPSAQPVRDPGILDGTVTLPGTPASMDATMIAVDRPAPVDRTMIAAEAAPVVRTDATVMLPGSDRHERPPVPVDRTVMVSNRDMPPAEIGAPVQWSPPRSGETQPIAIDPSASSHGRRVEQAERTRAGLLVALIGVVVIVGLVVGLALAWPYVRDRLAAERGEDASGTDASVVDASATTGSVEVAPPVAPASDAEPTPEPPVADTSAPPEVPPPEVPPPDTQTPPEDPPPDTKTPPPEDPPPDSKTPPPEDPPPDTKTPPEPKTPKSPNKPKAPKKPKTPKHPTVPEFKPGPFVPP